MRLHLYNNLLPRCVSRLPAPLLGYVPTMVTFESTMLVPHCCNGRTGRTGRQTIRCSVSRHHKRVFAALFILLSAPIPPQRVSDRPAPKHCDGRQYDRMLAVTEHIGVEASTG